MGTFRLYHIACSTPLQENFPKLMEIPSVLNFMITWDRLIIH